MLRLQNRIFEKQLKQYRKLHKNMLALYDNPSRRHEVCESKRRSKPINWISSLQFLIDFLQKIVFRLVSWFSGSVVESSATGRHHTGRNEGIERTGGKPNLQRAHYVCTENQLAAGVYTGHSSLQGFGLTRKDESHKRMRALEEGSRTRKRSRHGSTPRARQSCGRRAEGAKKCRHTREEGDGELARNRSAAAARRQYRWQQRDRADTDSENGSEFGTGPDGRRTAGFRTGPDAISEDVPRVPRARVVHARKNTRAHTFLFGGAGCWG